MTPRSTSKLALLILALSVTLAQRGLAVEASSESAVNPVWVEHIRGLGRDIAFDLTETSDGRLCLTGTFSHSATFGRGDRAIVLGARAVQDIYVACYTAGGELTAVSQLDAALGDEPRAIAPLPDGDLVITGRMTSIPDSSIAMAAGGADIFVMRLDVTGRTVWSRRFGGVYGDAGTAIAHDGQLYLAGNFRLRLPYEVHGKPAMLASAGSQDVFLFALSTDGEVLWGKRFGGEGRDEARALGVGPGGEIYLAGTFESDAGSEAMPTLTSAGSLDAFLLSFSADGEPRWARRMGGTLPESIAGMAVDGGGRVFLAGSFEGDMALGTTVKLSSAGRRDLFTAAVTADGVLEWAHRFGEAGDDQALDVSLSGYGYLLLAGQFGDRSDSDAALIEQLPAAATHGRSGAFLLELDSHGGQVASYGLGANGMKRAFAVSVLSDGDLALAGLLDATPLLSEDAALLDRRSDETDVFLARLERARVYPPESR